jgi:C4-dicarboxylate-specific signal transduction histidine kinase
LLIGRISAGLARELGNPLGIAAMNLDVVRAEYDRLSREGRLGPSSLGAALVDLESSVLRMQSLLAHLRPFVAQTDAELTTVRVAEVVSRAVHWAKDTLRGIDVQVDTQGVLALADPTRLEQIVLHLTRNAASAAANAPQPSIFYRVYLEDDRAVVAVCDNGPGMTQDMHEKIFEPFFTAAAANARRGPRCDPWHVPTRPARGPGLGLALCREYARQMGATVSVSSAPGDGASFHISMRRAPESQAPLSR